MTAEQERAAIVAYLERHAARAREKADRAAAAYPESQEHLARATVAEVLRLYAEAIRCQDHHGSRPQPPEKSP